MAGDRLHEQVLPAGIVVGPDRRVVDREDHLRLAAGDRVAAATARRVDGASDELDVRRRHRAGIPAAAIGRAERGHHALLHRLQHEKDQVLRHGLRPVHDIDQQLELGPAVDAAVDGDVLDEKAGPGPVHIFRRLGSPDEVVGQGVDVELAPDRRLLGAGAVEAEDRLGFRAADDAVAEHAPPERQQVVGGDDALGLDDANGIDIRGRFAHPGGSVQGGARRAFFAAG